MVAIRYGIPGAFTTALSWDDELMELKPVKGEDANPSLQDLQNINADVCAWLTIDDTGIDYPVVRGKDDMEYINKDVYGNFALSGSIFLSSANQPDFTDPYNLIYRHHMSNGAMFGRCGGIYGRGVLYGT